MSSVNDSILVTLLGTGYPAPRLDRFGPCTMVEAGGQRLLFDCGRGTMQRIFQINTNASTFNKLFLTHLHSDHTTGIPDLWITGVILLRHDNPLHVWGPKGTTDMMKHIREAFKVDLKVRKGLHVSHGSSSHHKGLEITSFDIDEGYVYEENGVKVVPFRVNHYDVYSDEPSLGYRVDYNGRSVVISGDTRFCENLIKHSEGVDLLVHEVASGPLGEELIDRYKVPLSHHTQPEECGKIFKIVKPKLAVFSHVIQFQGVSLEEMMTRTMDVYDGSVVFGEDLMRFEVGDTVKVISPE